VGSNGSCSCNNSFIEILLFQTLIFTVFVYRWCCWLQVNELGGVAGGSGGQLLSLGAGYELGACDLMTDIQNQLHELSLTDCDADQSSRFRAAKKPPSSYLCHLCFQKGHFIKDCPQVIITVLVILLLLMMMIKYRLI